MPGPREGQPRFPQVFTTAAVDVPMSVDIDGAPRLPQKVIIWKAGTYVFLSEPIRGTDPVEYARTSGPIVYAPADDHAMEIDSPVAALGAASTNSLPVLGIY